MCGSLLSPLTQTIFLYANVQCPIYTYVTLPAFSPLSVPSAVTNFTIKVTLTSIVLTWSAPEEPNGLIIFYEVNYRVNDGELVTASTASLGTTFTISPLTPGTNVTEISVSASSTTYEGERIAVDFITTLKQPRKLRD